MSSEKTTNQLRKRNGGQVSRRSVLAAGLAFPFVVPRHVLGGAGRQVPSDTLTIAVVGVGGMGRCKDHYHEWTESCKTGETTVCPIEFGCEMTEMALLGAMALRTKRTLAWDAKAMRVTNNQKANSLVAPPYRDGWTL